MSIEIGTIKYRTMREIIRDQILEYKQKEYSIKDYFMGYFNPPGHIDYVEELQEVVVKQFPEYLKLLNTIMLLK